MAYSSEFNPLEDTRPTGTYGDARDEAFSTYTQPGSQSDAAAAEGVSALIYSPRGTLETSAPSGGLTTAERFACVAGGTALATLAAARRGWLLLGLPISALLLYRAAVGQSALPSTSPGTAPARVRVTSDNVSVPAGQGVHIRENITINRSADVIYAALTTPHELTQVIDQIPDYPITFTAWNEVRIEVELPVIGAVPITLAFEPVNVVRNEVLAWKSPASAEFAHAGAIRLREAPGNRGTEVDVQVEYVAPGGPLGQALAAVMGVNPEQLVMRLLHRLKQWLETGEIARTTGQPSGREQERGDRLRLPVEQEGR